MSPSKATNCELWHSLTAYAIFFSTDLNLHNHCDLCRQFFKTWKYPLKIFRSWVFIRRSLLLASYFPKLHSLIPILCRGEKIFISCERITWLGTLKGEHRAGKMERGLHSCTAVHSFIMNEDLVSNGRTAQDLS